MKTERRSDTTAVRRDTAARNRHRDSIRKTGQHCHICGEPIDYALPITDPKAFVADHVVPLAKGGADSLANKRAAHRDCNRAKADRLDGGPIIRRSRSLVLPPGGTP